MEDVPWILPFSQVSSCSRETLGKQVMRAVTGTVQQCRGKHLAFEIALSSEAAPLLISSVYSSMLLNLPDL